MSDTGCNCGCGGFHDDGNPNCRLYAEPLSPPAPSPTPVPEASGRAGEPHVWFGFDEEHGDLDPDAAIERLLAHRDDDDLGPWTLTEFDCHPTEHHLPSAEHVVEWIVEWGSENGEVGEDWGDHVDCAIGAGEVGAAAEALIAAIAKGITYRMARTLVAEHVVTRTADGKVLMDGEIVSEWEPEEPPAGLCCHACFAEVDVPRHALPARRAITCHSCGSSDCPKATSHLNACPLAAADRGEPT